MKRNKKDWRAFLQLPYTLPKYRISRAASDPAKHEL